MTDSALAGRHVVLGLTGGIACYKSAELVRLLVKAGATVQVAMTEAATRFITPLTLQALSGRPVLTSQWQGGVDNGMPHIDLSRGADAIIVAPASADFMARLAHGLADDLLSTLCLARDCPLLLAPAMNKQMWQSAPTQRNAAQLRLDGVAVFGPGAGEQACGEVGDGRMLEAEQLLELIIASFQPKRLAGRHIVITAGPTFEPLDPVRGITNRSSGKMGFALARAAAEAGARVHLIAGPCHLATPMGVERTDVETAREMQAATLQAVNNTGGKAADVFVAVAAVSDWRAATVVEQKIKKLDARLPHFELVENPDILASVAALPRPPYCVGFAAETSQLDAYAQTKRQSKGIPLLIGNLGQHTFGRDDNEVVIYDEHGSTPIPRADKLSIARRIVAEIAVRLARA